MMGDSSSASDDSASAVSDALSEWGFRDLIPHFTRNEIDFPSFINLTERDIINFLPYKRVLDFYPVFEREVPALRKRKRVDSDADTPSTSLATIESTPDDVTQDDCILSDESVDEQLVSDLKKLFDKTFPGQLLMLTKYDDITDQDRNLIASIIVCDELRRETKKTITAARLFELAKATAVVFDGESSNIYYTPYRKINHKVFQAKGKFCTQMYAWRKRALDVGLITPGQCFKKSKTDTSQCDVPEDVLKSIDWLKVNLGPFNIATIHWKASYDYRDQYLVANNDLGAIETYFNTFPILRQPKLGLELMLQDFMQSDRLNGTASNFSKYWPKFAERFINKLTTKIIPSEELENLKVLVQKEQGVNVSHHILLHFSRIFPTPVVVKGKKPNHWTPTKAEAQLGFLGLYHSEEDFQTSIHDKVKRLSSFKKPLSFQPFAAIVGPNVRRVQKCYVVIQPNDIYEVDTPYEAIDYTFKVIQVLDAQYPAESKLLWLTIQQGIYKLFTESDDKITSPQLVPILKYFNKD